MPILKVLTGSVSLTVLLYLRAFSEPVAAEPVVVQVLLSCGVLDLEILWACHVDEPHPCLEYLEIEKVPLTMWPQRN